MNGVQPRVHRLDLVLAPEVRRIAPKITVSEKSTFGVLGSSKAALENSKMSIPSGFAQANSAKLDFIRWPSGPNVAYCRFSDDELQNATSIEQQTLVARNDAAKNGHTIPDDCIFADHGLKGWDPNRPALNRLMQLIENGFPCKHLYLADLSRQARDMEQAMKFQKFMDFHGVVVHYVAHGLVSGTPGFHISHMFHAWQAEEFLRTLGAAVKRGQLLRFKTGYHALAKTFGYEHEDEYEPQVSEAARRRGRGLIGVRVRINPIQAGVVRLIYELYLLGWGYDAIARHLNKLGIMSPRRPTKHAERLWGTSSVRTILENDRYTGVVRYGKTGSKKHPTTGKIKHFTRPKDEWEEDHVEDLRIISDDDFARVQQLRKSRNFLSPQVRAGLHKAKGVYLFSSLLRCGECGGPMNIHQPGTYMCSVAYKNGGCRNRMKLHRQSFETVMLELLGCLIKEARSFDEMVDAMMAELYRLQRDAERHAAVEAALSGSAQEQIADINDQLTNLAIAVGYSPSSATLIARINQLEAERDLLLKRLQTPKPNAAPEPDRAMVTEHLSKALENLSASLNDEPHALRDEFRARIEHLVVTPVTLDGKIVLELTGDLRLFAGADEKMLGRTLQASTQHFEPVLNLSGLLVKTENNGKVLHVDLACDSRGGELRLAA